MAATLNPLAGRSYIIQTLLDQVDAWLISKGKTPRVGDRIGPAREGYEPDGWPFILVSQRGDGTYEDWGDTLTLASEDVLVRLFMREDECPGIDVEEFCADIDGALQAALSGVQDPAASPAGTTHGCRILGPYRPPIYGTQGQHICEMGYFARVVTT